MAATRTNKEGRVNVPLGQRLRLLEQEATKAKTNKGNLARILINDGLDRLASGEFVIKPQTIEPAHAATA